MMRTARAATPRAGRLGAALAVLAGTALVLLAATALALFPARAADAATPVPEIHGGLDAVFSSRSDGFSYNTIGYGMTPFDAYQLRLMVAAQPNSAFNLDAEVRFSEAGGVWLYGAYATWTPNRDRDFHLQIGKLPWAVGTWGERSDPEHNPLIGVPLIYSFPTALQDDVIPPNGDALINAPPPVAWSSEYDSTGGEERGMRIVDDSKWDVGATLRGDLHPLEVAVGFVQGAPGSPAPGRDTNDGKSVLGRIGLRPWPMLRFGVSGSWGPYLNDAVAWSLPWKDHVTQYDQELGMADVEIVAGHLELRGEGAINVWQTPTVGDLRVWGGYGEARFSLATRWAIAARADRLRFSDVLDSAGRALPWDHDLDRLEGGIEYRVERRTSLKAVGQRTWDHDAGENEIYHVDLVALQFTISY